jgi:hypothetical protein
VLQRKQREFDKEWNGNKNSKRKLAVEYYNIWVAPSGNLNYNIHDTVEWTKKGVRFD